VPVTVFFPIPLDIIALIVYNLSESVVLGRGKLKLPKFALLMAVGLLVQISSISAQESGQDYIQNDPLRAAELAMTFEEGTASIVTVAGPSIWDVVRMVLVLALAAVAIYGIVFFLRRSSKQMPGNDPYLKILANAHLGHSRYVHIVSVGNKAWLLGASEGGVNLIGEIDDKDTLDEMLHVYSSKTTEASGRFPDFLSMLRRPGAPAGSAGAGVDEIRKRRERLKGLFK
jgi:flagellar protein FliO/FliZ